MKRSPRVLVLSRGGNLMGPALAAIGSDEAATGALRVTHNGTCSLLAGAGPCDCEPDLSWHPCADADEAFALVRSWEAEKGGER